MVGPLEGPEVTGGIPQEGNSHEGWFCKSKSGLAAASTLPGVQYPLYAALHWPHSAYQVAGSVGPLVLSYEPPTLLARVNPPLL